MVSLSCGCRDTAGEGGAMSVLSRGGWLTCSSEGAGLRTMSGWAVPGGGWGCESLLLPPRDSAGYRRKHGVTLQARA